MTDVAVLGLAVDSSQVTKATTALTGLAAAAKPAATAAADLQKSTAAVSPLMAAAAQASDKHSESLRGQRMVLRGLAGDLALLGPQFGQAASMAAVLYIENAHLLTGFGGLKNTLGALITPTNLMIGGLVGLAAGSVLALVQWKAFALELDDLAKQAGVTSDSMAKLQAAASFHGISSADFTKGVGGFAAQVYDAKNNMGTLIDVLRSNGVSAAGDFTTLLGKAADLIKNAASDQQRLVLLQQMGLPATMDFVRFMSQGAAGIKEAADEAHAFGGAANDQMVAKAREFDEAWNKTWTNFSLGWRGAVVTASNGLDYLITKGRQALSAAGVDVGGNLLRNGIGSRMSQSDADSFYKATGAGTGGVSGKATVDPAALQKAISDQQQYISLLGTTASAQQTATQIDLAAQAAHLKGISITNAQVAALHQLAYENTLGITAIKAQTDAENTAAATVGMSVGQTAAYTAAQNALNQAKRDGRTLTAADTAAIQANSTALGQAASRADELKFEYDTFSGTMRDFETGLRNGKSAWDSFAAAGTNALGKIADRLMDMASKSLWQAAFPTNGGGGLGGLFSGLFGSSSNNPGGAVAAGNAAVGDSGLQFHTGGVIGSDGTARPYVHPSYFDDAPRFHSGGMPGLDEVPIIAKKGEGVFTAAQMKALAPAGQSSAPSVTINQALTFNNADPGSEARLRAYVDQSHNQAVQQAVQAVSTISKNSPNYRASFR